MADAAALTTVTEPMAAEIERRFGVDRPTVVLNCRPRWRPDEPTPGGRRLRDAVVAAGAAGDAPILLYQGAFREDQGIEELLEALGGPHLRDVQVVAAFLGFRTTGGPAASRSRGRPGSDRGAAARAVCRPPRVDGRRRPRVRRGTTEDDQPGTDDPEQALREPDGRCPGGRRRRHGCRAARGRGGCRDHRGAMVGRRARDGPRGRARRPRRRPGPFAGIGPGPSPSSATTGRRNRPACSPPTATSRGAIGRPSRPGDGRDGLLSAPRRAVAQQRFHGRLPIVEVGHEPHSRRLRRDGRRASARGFAGDREHATGIGSCGWCHPRRCAGYRLQASRVRTPAPGSARVRPSSAPRSGTASDAPHRRSATSCGRAPGPGPSASPSVRSPSMSGSRKGS